MTDIETSETDSNEFQSDNLQRFIFDGIPVRGEWIHLSQSWQEVITRREYPLAIRNLLGQMMAAAGLLAATVKIKGRLVLQIKSEGPVSLMMVECTSENTVRAFAQWDGDIANDASLVEITGAGALAITIDVEGAKQPYQGLVGLDGDSIAALLETYFKQSEQLETRIWLAANEQSVSGLFMQQLPGEISDDEHDQEHWTRLTHLASTVNNEELLELGAGTLLHRLFHEEECRLLSTTEFNFACACSRQRVAETISLLGEKDAIELVETQGKIEVACEFCNEHYYFDKVDVAQVFSVDNISEPDSTTLH